MTWLIYALLAPLLWSIVNHADKYLIDKYFKHSGKGVGSIMLYSTLFSIIVIPVVFYLNSEVILSISNTDKLILILSGLLNALAIFFYIFALNEDETSVIMPFFQMISVFAYIQGFFLLGESLTKNQTIASLLIIFGALILSTEKNPEGKIRFKKKAIFFALISSFLFAGYSSLFKYGTLQEGTFWSSIFWEHFGILLFGLCLLVFKSNYRKDFLSSIKESGKSILALNIGSELLTATGNSFAVYASLLTTLALANVVINGAQPVFVFLLGILLTILLPKIAEEDISKGAIAKKAFAIIIMIIGTIFLS